jgi:indole-3-glycerol phosphate synthase
MSVLAEICDKKREHIAAQKSAIPLTDIKSRAADAPAPKGFLKALQQAAFPAIIAEVKKASPSKGIIREDFNPAEIARLYEQNGAACLSVLTDTPYFQGTDDIFKTVRATTTLPLLRKDFMLDEYQIYESRILGADCILLIMAALTDAEAATLHTLAINLGMDVLVETHEHQEITRALKLNPHMIGVNNRNLKTLDVTVQTSIDLSPHIPNTIHKIAESGLTDHATLQTLQTHGYNTFLIGESLMRQPDIAAALQSIRG